MQRLFLGSVLAAVAMFFWGFLFWAAGPGDLAMSHGANNEALRTALRDHVPSSGMYFIPDMAGREDAAFMQEHADGPIAMLAVRKEGADAMSPTVFASGFAHMFVSALLMAYLLSLATPSLRTYGARVTFVVLAGLVGSFWSQVGAPIWFFHPWSFHLMTMVYDVIGWGVTGAILAKFVTPRVA